VSSVAKPVHPITAWDVIVGLVMRGVIRLCLSIDVAVVGVPRGVVTTLMVGNGAS
jgi:hypothetical protein